MGRTRPPYPREFRAEAVRLARESGRPVPEVARELGVSAQTLASWLAVDETSRSLSADERAELMRLRRETQILREERDVLRKAVDFFAEETTASRS